MSDLGPDANASFCMARDNASFANDTSLAHALVAAMEGMALQMAALGEQFADFAKAANPDADPDGRVAP